MTSQTSELTRLQSKIHTNSSYPIGPYVSAKDYAFACYERELKYYGKQDDDIDWPLFNPKPEEDDWAPGLPLEGPKREVLLKNRATFIRKLEAKRDELVSDPSILPVEEPFVLCHNDLEGRNILIRDGHIVCKPDISLAMARALTCGSCSRLGVCWKLSFE